MISQNGNIPPIFVPPGYVSHVIEENGIRRVIVVPSTNTSNVTDNQTVLCSPTFNHPTIHHPSFHHFGFPVNGIHSPYHNGYFSHPHVSAYSVGVFAGEQKGEASPRNLFRTCNYE